MTANSFRFGVFAVSVARREIHRGSARVEVPAKVFDCVNYLIEHRDRAVGRDELISAVWGRVDVTDNLLAQTILRARRAFDDDSDAQRFIRTITGFGYRWVHEVDADADADADARAVHDEAALPAPSAAPPDAPPPPRLKSSRRAHVLVAIAASCVIAALIAAAHIFGVKPGADTPAKRLAFVLPAVVQNAPDFAWARLGIMDLVAQRLREAAQATVPSETVVALARFATQQPTPGELRNVAAATGATFFIETTVRREGSVWRVALVKVEDATRSSSYEGADGDLLQATAHAVTRATAAMDLSPPQVDEGFGAGATLAQELIAARLQGRLGDARALVEQAPPDVRADPRVRLEIAALDFFQQRADRSRAALMQLQSEKPPDASPVFKARVTTALAVIANSERHYADGERLATEAIDAIKALDPAIVGNALGSALDIRAIARAAMGAYDKAEDDFATARTALTTTGNISWLAVVDLNHATMQMDRDRFAPASQALRETTDRLRKFGLARHELLAHARLVVCDLALQDFDAATQDDARIAEVISRVDESRALAMARLAHAEAAYALGHVGDAQATVAALLADAGAADSVRGPSLRIDSLLASERGDMARSGVSARASVALKWGDVRAREYATTWLALARAQRSLAPGSGTDDLARARAWASSSIRPAAARLVDLLEAEHLAARGQDAAARALFERTLRATTESAVPVDLVEVTVSYTTWLVAKGDFDRAITVLGRNHEWAASNFRVAVAEARLYRATGNETLWRSAVERAQKTAGERAMPSEILRFESQHGESTTSMPVIVRGQDVALEKWRKAMNIPIGDQGTAGNPMHRDRSAATIFCGTSG